jgi:hypothetical protein
MAQLFGSSSQPFFRFATMLDLPPVPDEAWRAYIRQRLTGRGISIDDGAIDAILSCTGGHPYDTMQVAYEAYLLARRARQVDSSASGRPASRPRRICDRSLKPNWTHSGARAAFCSDA